MQLRRKGELKLLEEIRRRFSSASQIKEGGVIIGIGDDAAAIESRSEKILVTTDMMNEGVHFKLDYAAPFHLGFKLVSVNVSDIMAMGGAPRYLFLNVALKGTEKEDFFWELFEGISYALKIYKIELLGGDLSSAVHDITLSATLIGAADRVVTRGGASAGDMIYVTSTPGDSACGLEILKRLAPGSKKKVQGSKFKVQSSRFEVQGSRLKVQGEDRTLDGMGELMMVFDSLPVTLDWKVAEPLLRRHLMPVARDSGAYAERATSMIDISDGLFIDLCRICDESKVGARVYLEKIPLSDEMKYAAEIMGLDPLRLASSGGEDYELLFTAPPTPHIPPLEWGTGGVKVTCIGEITGRRRVVVDSRGKESVLKPEGYRHFGIPR